jgi:hypothetical protein
VSSLSIFLDWASIANPRNVLYIDGSKKWIDDEISANFADGYSWILRFEPLPGASNNFTIYFKDTNGFEIAYSQNPKFEDRMLKKGEKIGHRHTGWMK